MRKLLKKSIAALLAATLLAGSFSVYAADSSIPDFEETVVITEESNDNYETCLEDDMADVYLESTTVISEGVDEDFETDEEKRHNEIRCINTFSETYHRQFDSWAIPLVLTSYGDYKDERFYFNVYFCGGTEKDNSENFRKTCQKQFIASYGYDSPAYFSNTAQTEVRRFTCNSTRYGWFCVECVNAVGDKNTSWVYMSNLYKFDTNSLKTKITLDRELLGIKIENSIESNEMVSYRRYISSDNGLNWNEIYYQPATERSFFAPHAYCQKYTPYGEFRGYTALLSYSASAYLPLKYGSYKIKTVAYSYDDPKEYAESVVDVNYYQYIKGICQMPYNGPGGGYLIGFESYENPNNEYRYEMLILDCTLLAQGKPAWIMSSGKLKTNGNCLWTVWQPQYGYYWTLFRLYDEHNNLLEEVCYGFANVC